MEHPLSLDSWFAGKSVRDALEGVVDILQRDLHCCPASCVSDRDNLTDRRNDWVTMKKLRVLMSS